MKPGLTVISEIDYRGGREEYSNQFHFTGSAPTDAAGWDALCAAFIPLFRALIPSQVTVKRIYCYTDTANDSVHSYDLANHGGVLTGTAAYGGGVTTCPGDSAYWVRWTTGRTSSKGKPVYLRKYFHPGISVAATKDLLDTTLKGNITTAAAAIAASSGAWPGIAGPTYDVPGTVATVSQWITTRTLKRRGKRP